jgi:hypothetical protein
VGNRETKVLDEYQRIADASPDLQEPAEALPGRSRHDAPITSGDTVRRASIASIAIAAVLALGAGSTVVAADPTPAPEIETPNPSAEIAIDPTFITAEPTKTPRSQVQGSTVRTQRTPPPTDAVDGTPQSPGTGLPALVMLLAAGATLVLTIARPARSRHR